MPFLTPARTHPVPCYNAWFPRISGCGRGSSCGVTVEFKRDANGQVSEAALNDNGTAVVLKRK